MNNSNGHAVTVRNVLLVDPSMFTAPYDAALSGGLEALGINAQWATRQLRADEENEIGAARSLDFFYPLSDGPRRRQGGLWRLVKGIEHASGMKRLGGLVQTGRFDIIHFQWSVLPLIDARAIRRMRSICPVVLTVHDSTPFNGKQVSRLQRDGFGAVLSEVDRIIVHTPKGKATLVDAGVADDMISVIPHGILPGGESPARAPDGRWRVVLFGKLQDYKGIDVLIEALGQLAQDQRERLSVIVAGEPMSDMAHHIERARALGLGPELLEFRLHRHSATEMATVLGEADAFFFPYHPIEASGVLFPVAQLKKWVIASDLGAFSEMVGRDDCAGTLVAPGSAADLAGALSASIGRRPTRDLSANVPSWTSIASMTLRVYQDALGSWNAETERRAA